MANVEITVEKALADAGLSALLTNATNLGPLMAEIAPVLLNATHRAFATESSPQGQRWAELAISTQIKKDKSGKTRGAHPILIASGEFFSSIVAQAGSDYAEVGTALGFPTYLQSGTSKMPAREWLGLSSADETSIIEIAYRHLTP